MRSRSPCSKGGTLLGRMPGCSRCMSQAPQHSKLCMGMTTVSLWVEWPVMPSLAGITGEQTAVEGKTHPWWACRVPGWCHLVIKGTVTVSFAGYKLIQHLSACRPGHSNMPSIKLPVVSRPQAAARHWGLCSRSIPPVVAQTTVAEQCSTRPSKAHLQSVPALVLPPRQLLPHGLEVHGMLYHSEVPRRLHGAHQLWFAEGG